MQSTKKLKQIFQTKKDFITCSKLIINELGGSPVRSDNVYFASDEQAALAFFIAHVERERLHETQSELKPIWNLTPLWNVVPFTWQFTWRFHCRNFPNNDKTLMHMCQWYLLIIANLINLMQTWLMQNILR